MHRESQADDPHHHVCPKCFTVWGHDPDEIWNQEENKRMHKCPNPTCGLGWHWVALTAEEAARAVVERDPLPGFNKAQRARADRLGLLDE